jgi:glucose/arabinose dehydrogenase
MVRPKLLIAAAILILAGLIVLTLPRQQLKPSEDQQGAVLAQNLNVPWDLAFLPGGDLLVTERIGTLVRIDRSGRRWEIAVPGVRQRGEGGLLGVVLHPEFSQNNQLYLYMSTPASAGQTLNQVVRYKLVGDALTDAKVIIGNIPGAVYHDGGRLEFGPDGLLYVTTGDATNEDLAQDLSSLAGKILRLRDDGSLPADNPFSTAVYSYGHRNPQGLAWDDQGRLWSTEHGRSGITSGLDEVNLIVKGRNYGWPVIEGPQIREGMVSPALQSGADTTWAPASAAYLSGSFFFGGLKGEALYEAALHGERVTGLKAHYQGVFGRIRTVRVGPDKMLYLTTSNRDGRGSERIGDDKVIRIDPAALE